MLSNLIPLGRIAENGRKNKPSGGGNHKSDLEQSLTSDSLLLYLGNRTPLLATTRDDPSQQVGSSSSSSSSLFFCFTALPA
jgi:hypothetical protein